MIPSLPAAECAITYLVPLRSLHQATMVTKANIAHTSHPDVDRPDDDHGEVMLSGE